jgi:riboflavin kinase/FMN adenylyltransferase
MRIITNLKQLNRQFRRPVVTIGIFDGVHLGHKKILAAVRQEAAREKGTSVVVTFNPHPKKVLNLIGVPPLLISLRHRLRLIEAEGIDAACVIDFSGAFASRRAHDFVKEVLVQKIGARCVITGEDFRFGRKKEGDAGLLKALGARHGFLVKTVPLFKIGQTPVSSTRIRRLITAGSLAAAARLLGRPVSVLGTVVRGSRLGRQIGYPTANIDPHHEAIPPEGVYAVYAICGRKRYKAILNIGRRPTFDRTKHLEPRTQNLEPKTQGPIIETHILGFAKKIYGKDIEVVFVKKLRPEKKFSSRDRLVKQIRIDERNADMIL